MSDTRVAFFPSFGSPSTCAWSTLRTWYVGWHVRCTAILGRFASSLAPNHDSSTLVLLTMLVWSKSPTFVSASAVLVHSTAVIYRHIETVSGVAPVASHLPLSHLSH